MTLKALPFLIKNIRNKRYCCKNTRNIAMKSNQRNIIKSKDSDILFFMFLAYQEIMNNVSGNIPNIEQCREELATTTNSVVLLKRKKNTGNLATNIDIKRQIKVLRRRQETLMMAIAFRESLYSLLKYCTFVIIFFLCYTIKDGVLWKCQ